MSAPPYMKFYPGDYDRDTGHLRGPVEHGAYFMLLKAMWNAGGKLPADDRKLARLVQCTDKEWAALKEIVLPFFKRRGGILRHKRIDHELAVYERSSVQASKAGKSSAFQRANKNKNLGSTDVQRSFNQPEPEPEPKDRNKSVPILIEGMTENGNRPDVRRTTTNGRRSAWSDAIAERNRSIAGDDEPETGGQDGFGDGGGTRLFVASARKA